MTKITLGECPARPESTKALGLTTELWNGLTRCWYVNPKDRITISEILVLLRYVWVLFSTRPGYSTFTHHMVYDSRSGTGIVGPSGSELSIDGAPVSVTDGMMESMNIPRRPSNTRHYQRSSSHTPLPTGSPSNHHSGLIGLPEKSGAMSVRIETSILD